MPVRAFTMNGLPCTRVEKTAIPYEDAQEQPKPWSFQWPPWAITKINLRIREGMPLDRAIRLTEFEMDLNGEPIQRPG